jgi:type 1 glutamine amidotransferase
MVKHRWFIFILLLAALTAPAKDLKKSPHVLFMIGESEYGTRTNLPKFAKEELEPRGVRCTFVVTPTEDSDNFPGMEALKDADVLFISVRRHAPPAEQMKLIRDHIAAGKAVVGIRTASHAFGKKQGQKEGAWEGFDHEVLGGNYQGHYQPGIAAIIKPALGMTHHPVLAGVPIDGFKTTTSLYKNSGLNQANTILIYGQLDGRPELEPVAWVNLSGKGPVFYTSLGAPDDFRQPAFRRLLLNGIFWAWNGQNAYPSPSSVQPYLPKSR